MDEKEQWSFDPAGARVGFRRERALHSCRLPAAIQLVVYLSVAAVTGVVIARIELSAIARRDRL
jgi:hypothetical protein